MLLPFYQRIVPSNQLIHVGDFDVEPGTKVVRLPIFQAGQVFMEGPHLVPPPHKGQFVTYKRQMGEIFDCFVGIVPLTQAPKEPKHDPRQGNQS